MKLNYTGAGRTERICKVCSSNQTETEYLFFLCCQTYTYIRKKYFHNISWPNINMFDSILSSNNSKLLFKAVKYLAYAMKLCSEMSQHAIAPYL